MNGARGKPKTESDSFLVNFSDSGFDPTEDAVREEAKLEKKTTIPDIVDPASKQVEDAIGYKAFVMDAKKHHYLGVFVRDCDRSPFPEIVRINPLQFHSSIADTVSTWIMNRVLLQDDVLMKRAQVIADGCSVLAYMRLSRLLASEAVHAWDDNSLRQPRVPADLLVPSAYAYAIQQLGVVSAMDQPTVRMFMPQFATTGHRFGIPTGRSWNPHAYAKAVEYCKGLGMNFSVVDLKVKDGTAWWLLKEVVDDGFYTAHCCLPHTNYTTAQGVVFGLFINNPDAARDPPLLDFGQLFPANSSYGTMIRNPHFGFNVSCFEGIYEMVPEE